MSDKEVENKLVDDVPDLSDVTGRFGKFQKRILFVSTMRSICIAFAVSTYYFVNQSLQFSCDVNEISADYYLNSTANESCFRLAYSVTKSPSGQKVISEETVPCERFNYEVDKESSTIVDEWDLVCSRKWMISFGYMVFSLGSFLCYLPVGQLFDKFGRRPISLICVALMTILSSVIAFSTSMPMFLVIRFLLGCLYPALQSSAFLIYMESVGPEYREYIVYSFSAMYGVGILVVSLTSWLIPNWRIFMFVSSLPVLLPYLLLFHWLVPESTRWLLSTKRYDRAQNQIVKQARINGKEIGDINQIMAKLKRKIDLDSHSEKASFVDILRNEHLRRTAAILYFTFCTIVFIIYGLPLTIALEGASIYLTMSIIGTVNIIAVFLYFLVVKYLKRKKGLLLMLILNGIVFLAVIPMANDLFWLKFVLFMTARISSSIAYNFIYVYANELFPTNLRSVGVNGAMTAGRIGALMGPIMDYVGRFHGRQVPLIIYAALSLSTVVVCFLLPNTEDKHLPNTVVDINILSKKRKIEVHYQNEIVTKMSE